MEKLQSIFREVPDPRADNARHNLVDILVIALAAVLCGAESCADMAEFGCAKQGLLQQLLGLEHEIPSHDTFSRVFRLLDPKAFEPVFRHFMAEFAKELHGVVAVDGKALRGAFEQGRKTTPLQLVNVWAVEARLAMPSAWRPTATKWLRPWKFLDCCRSTAVSSRLTRCIAMARWRNTFSIAAGNMPWPSRPTGRRCSPTRRGCWSRSQSVRKSSRF